MNLTLYIKDTEADGVDLCSVHVGSLLVHPKPI